MAEERTQEEQLEDKREVARANLDNDYMASLAAARIGGTDYGKLLSGVYEQTVSERPDEETYEKLFLPALLSNQGRSINRDYLESTATNIMVESLEVLPADEILGMVGVSDEFAKTYEGQEMSELSDNERRAIVNTYLTNMVEEQIEKRLPEMRKARAGNLEKALTEGLE